MSTEHDGVGDMPTSSQQPLSIDDRMPLSSTAHSIPILGFGVYKLRGDSCVNSCLSALATGYRHIDSADLYLNSHLVREAVLRSGLDRHHVFLTTKFGSPRPRRNRTVASDGCAVEIDDKDAIYHSVRESVARIAGDDDESYVDLLLIHVPGPSREHRMKLWAAMERLHSEGKARNIGAAGKMATSFEPSLSSSISRQTMAPVGPSAADTLPNINFGFDDLRDRMAKFTAKFDAFIEQGRKRVLDERNQFRMNVAELQEDQRMKKRDIEIVQVKTSTHQQSMQKEDAETREMQAAIKSFEAERDQHIATRDNIKEQIAQTQAEIDARLAAQRQHAQQQEAQARFNVPELDFWITNLCLKIEGAGHDDRLKFVYSHVDEKDWEREAWFELVTSSRDYDVKHCRPKLEREKVERVLDRVNETRELVVLLKGMRELFVEAMKS